MVASVLYENVGIRSVEAAFVAKVQTAMLYRQGMSTKSLLSGDKSPLKSVPHR